MQALSKSAKKRLAKKKKEARENGDNLESAQGPSAGEGAVEAEVEADPVEGENDGEAANKKKKKKKKKKSGEGSTPSEQTDPPTVPVASLFPDGVFPEGEWQSYIGECAFTPLPFTSLVRGLFTGLPLSACFPGS